MTSASTRPKAVSAEDCHVKSLPLTVSLVAAALIGCASPYAPQEFNFDALSGPGSMTLGTVESVATVRIERDIHAYEEPPELSIQPELGDQMVIRLDDGRAITLVLTGMQRFQAGERVRVLSHTYSSDGPSVIHEWLRVP
jgi:outer membrane lipoprotein SlyB